ncbi:Lrp/AsnC family transcriptional regulator [Candidatus Woesearchaeota archaeon]|nr:Lrp/AsnC family transcriptional regulator [Candidatus Woesearchaeota archaeon]
MLSKNELRVLSHLRTNSRMTLSEIAYRTSLSVSNIHSIVKKLGRVVEKHVSLLDFQSLGFPLKVHFALSAYNKKALKYFLLNHSSINSLSSVMAKMNDSYFDNPYDYYFEAIFKNFVELEDFKKRLEIYDIIKSDEHLVVEDLKKEEFKAQKASMSTKK